MARLVVYENCLNEGGLPLLPVFSADHEGLMPLGRGFVWRENNSLNYKLVTNSANDSEYELAKRLFDASAPVILYLSSDSISNSGAHRYITIPEKADGVYVVRKIKSLSFPRRGTRLSEDELSYLAKAYRKLLPHFIMLAFAVSEGFERVYLLEEIHPCVPVEVYVNDDEKTLLQQGHLRVLPAEVEVKGTFETTTKLRIFNHSVTSDIPFDVFYLTARDYHLAFIRSDPSFNASFTITSPDHPNETIKLDPGSYALYHPRPAPTPFGGD